jgi:hypothetical protein
MKAGKTAVSAAAGWVAGGLEYAPAGLRRDWRRQAVSVVSEHQKRRKRAPNLCGAHNRVVTFRAHSIKAPAIRCATVRPIPGGRVMSRQTTFLLVRAAAFGAGVLGMSSAFAGPAEGVVIGEAVSVSATQKVVWHDHAWGWGGVGWRRGSGWRAGWDAYRPVYGYGRVYGYGLYGYTIYYLAYGCQSCRSHP